MEFSPQEIILLVTFIISLAVFFQKPAPLYLKLFAPYFAVMLASEIRGEYLSHHGKYNAGLYNISVIIEFWFYYFVLREIIRNIKMKQVIFYALFIYPLLASANLFFLQKEVGFNSVNFMAGCLLTVVFCIYYFFELFQETETKSLSKLPAFWIVTGIFFNNVCLFPMFALISYMKFVPNIILNNLTTILAIISILTSILYTIGFLCRIRKSTL